MATKLIKPIRREVEIQDNLGKTGTVVLTIYQDRLELRRKGTSRSLSVEYKDLGKVLKIPYNAPGRYFANPLGWLVNE